MTSRADFQHILIIEDDLSKRVFALEEAIYSLGRNRKNNIPIHDRQVSRHHATLVKEEDPKSLHFWYKIIDGDLEGNKSRNGLKINGNRCLEHCLSHGDLIFFGGKSQASYYIISNPAMISFLVAQPDLKEKNLNLEDFSKTTLPSQEYLASKNGLNQDELIRLASFPELSPTPIIEINYRGEITYLNSAASLKFNNIYETKLKHPILAGLLQQNQNKQGSLIVREIKIEDEYFDEYIHYLSERSLVRIYVFDLTHRRKIEKALQESEARYRAVVKQISEGICLVDVESKKIIEANDSYCKLLGYTQEELLATTLSEIIHYPQNFSEHLQKILSKKIHFLGESVHRRKDNYLIDVEVSVSLIYYHDKEAFCFTVRDITKRKQDEELLQYQAYYDSLTGLPNRMLFQKHLETALANAHSNNTLMAVMFLDVDHFKKINDTLGHSIGDQLLKSFGDRLKSCLRSSDVIGRWGGDEFTILIPEINQPEDISNLAKRILRSLEKPLVLAEHQLHVKSSIGIALYPENGQDAETLLKNADAALYRTKEDGRNHYQFYRQNMTFKVSESLELESLFSQSLAKGELMLYYQPRINIKSKAITAMETLIKWQHPEKGLMSFDKFLPLVEKTEQIIPIRDWLIKSACEQNQVWQTQGLASIPVSITLSPRQFHQSMLVVKVAEVLEKTKLPPSLLELEVNEKNILEDTDLSGQILDNLLKMGVQISIGDFGTSYRFLKYLGKFLFHTLKIDQSFIKELKDNSPDSGIISAMIALGNSFQMKVVAEGVEKQEQVDMLRQLNCEEMQGYLFSHPLSTIEATDLLKKGLG